MFEWLERRAVQDRREEMPSPIGDGLLITGHTGLMAGTQVASNLGWRAVEELRVGEKVLTFDNAMQTVTDIQRDRLVLPECELGEDHLPIHVPEGALYNRCDLWLMPEQGMLIECDAVHDAVGEPYAVVPARLLCGLRGIDRGRPAHALEVVTLAFARDEAVYVEGGMLAYCPRPVALFPGGDDVGRGLYERVDGRAGRFLMKCLREDDDIRAVASPPECMPAGIPSSHVRPRRPAMIAEHP
ncbi:Hint domain-containing protein [Lutimaribacter marinistellae]|uniref:Hint domain-containing protein n=1 Tax=Lutimaribacter marinistellae TaxID=1820329 RepID=A0ABV7TK71_9RHOB